MTWLPAVAAGPTDVDRTFGLRPNLYGKDPRDMPAAVVPTPDWPA